jgi:hypothetical protein
MDELPPDGEALGGAAGSGASATLWEWSGRDNIGDQPSGAAMQRRSNGGIVSIDTATLPITKSTTKSFGMGRRHRRLTILA